jgi:hypothetical protein
MRYRLTGTHPASREEIRNERDSGIPALAIARAITWGRL